MSDSKRMKTGRFILDPRDGPMELSVFCRVEEGTDAQRVPELVDMLNKRFKKLTPPQRSLMKITLIKNFNEKLMKEFTYPERDAITGKFLFMPWKGSGTRGSALEHLPQTTATEDDSASDFEDPEKRPKKGKSGSPAKKHPQSSLLNNPFFSPVKKVVTRASPVKGMSKSGSPSKGKSPVKGAFKAKTLSKDAHTEKRVSPRKGNKKDTPAGKKKTTPGKTKETPGKARETPRKSLTFKSPLVEKISPKQAGISVEKAIEELARKSNLKRKNLFADEGTDESDNDIQIVTEAGKQAVGKLIQVSPFKKAKVDNTRMEVDEPTGATTETFIVPVTEDSNFYATANVITEEMLERRMSQFLRDHIDIQANSEPMRQVVRQEVRSMFHEELMPYLDIMKGSIQQTVVAEVKKVLDNGAKRASVAKVLEDTATIKQAVSDFSIEHASIRVEISKMRESEADYIARSNSILSRLVPFEFMGQACDIFFGSHYVQEVILHFVKDGLTDIKSKVNEKIALTFSDAFFTKMAMAHLIWKQPLSSERIQYFKRVVPETLEKVIKGPIITFVRKDLELRGGTYLESWKVLRKTLSQRFTNSRTKQLEWAFEKVWNPEDAVDALHSIDNEFYFHNVHAIPTNIIQDEREEYKARLLKRKETRNAFEASLKEDKWQEGRRFLTGDAIWEGFRGPAYTRKVWSNYDTIKCIVASAAARKKDVTKLTWDELEMVPDVKAVYKKVVADHINSLDDLVKQFPYEPNYMERLKSNSDSEAELDEITSKRGRKAKSSSDESSTGEEDDEDAEDEASSEADQGEDEDNEEGAAQSEKGESSDSVVIESPSDFERNIDESALNMNPSNMAAKGLSLLPSHDPSDELLGIQTGSGVNPDEILEQLTIEKSIQDEARKKKKKK